jgi:hypothetical protein
VPSMRRKHRSILAGAGSAAGILAVCIGKCRRFFRANHFSLFRKTKEK